MIEPSWWLTFFAWVVGGTTGFVLAGFMAAGKRADEDAEELHEQILRREP